MAAPRIDPKVQKQLIKMCLRGMPHTEVAEVLGINNKTVGRYFALYLEQVHAENKHELDKTRTASVLRQFDVASRAREIAEAALLDPDKQGPRAAAPLLAIEQRAYQQIDKLNGVEAALKIEATVDISAEQARMMATLIKEGAQIAGFSPEEQKRLFAGLREAQAKRNT